MGMGATMGIKMGMGTESTGMGGNRNFVLKKFPHRLIRIKFTIIC